MNDYILSLSADDSEITLTSLFTPPCLGGRCADTISIPQCPSQMDVNVAFMAINKLGPGPVSDATIIGIKLSSRPVVIVHARGVLK